MLMAELSRRSGVPVATIKYYLREGLLPPGTATAATRAEYGEPHLRRLRLIRALVEIGEVPIASIAQILATVDSESVSTHELLGAVQYALGPQQETPSDPDEVWQAAEREASDLISELGWTVEPGAPARTLLVGSLAVLRRGGMAPPGPPLREYARAVGQLAKREVASVASAACAAGDRLVLAESAVVGIVLYERMLIALRRLAQEDASARLNGTGQ